MDKFGSYNRNVQRGLMFSQLDPVLMQSRLDRKSRRGEKLLAKVVALKEQAMLQQESFEATTISPRMSTRLELAGSHCPAYPLTPGPVGAKYVAPKPKKWVKAMRDANAKYIEDLKFCKFNTVKLPEPPNAARIEVKLKAPSAEIQEVKVMPQRPSVTLSDLYPPPQKKRHLRLKKPKSGIFINVTEKEAAKAKVKKKRVKKTAAQVASGIEVEAGTTGEAQEQVETAKVSATGTGTGKIRSNAEGNATTYTLADTTQPPDMVQYTVYDGTLPLEEVNASKADGTMMERTLSGGILEYTLDANGKKIPLRRIPADRNVSGADSTMMERTASGGILEYTLDLNGDKMPIRRIPADQTFSGADSTMMERTASGGILEYTLDLNGDKLPIRRIPADANYTGADSTMMERTASGGILEYTLGLNGDKMPIRRIPADQTFSGTDTTMQAIFRKDITLQPAMRETTSEIPSEGTSSGFGYEAPMFKELERETGMYVEEGQGQEAAEEYGGEGEEGVGLETAKETHLTKIFRRKVSVASKQTSIQSRELRGDQGDVMELPGVEKIGMKYRRESAVERYEPPVKIKRPKRGTFESHSFTKIHQPTLKTFYFGVKLGSVHQADLHFPEVSRNKQGICMPIAAYCYTMIKHPSNWMDLDIDTILEVGNDLFLQSAGNKHRHGNIEELTKEDLSKYCIIGEKKFRYAVSDPIVSGTLKTADKKIFNLTKALHIFFETHKAGILQTDTFNILIWKDKQFYFFDALPRTTDLYSSAQGKALMANFYDLASVITVMLTKSGAGNDPFIMYAIQVEKILGKDAEDVDKKEAIDERDNYQVLDETKAVLLGSFDLGDMCFSYSRNKQALPMAVIALVYSKITPPSAWYKNTVDKIMVIGNRFFLECFQCDSLREIQLEDLPAVFTVGPYLVEVYIYRNRVADMMWRKQECMLLKGLQTFFDKNTNGVLQIDKYTLAVWKQRDMYHLFDPYSRDIQGFHCRDGAACTSMHSNLESLVSTIAKNFDDKEYIFYVHSMKVVKIHRDPAQSYSLNLTMADYPMEDLIRMKMRRSKRCSTSKPVTVDFTRRAAMYGASPDVSLLEVGSGVASLTMDEIPSMIHKFPARLALKRAINESAEVVIDLDSPSLSDTQIDPERPKDEEVEVEFMDLGQYDLTADEKELAGKKEGEGEGVDALRRKMERDENRAAKEGEGEDFYMAQPQMTQVHSDSLEQKRSKTSIAVNTQLAYFIMPEEPLPFETRPEILQYRKMKQTAWECKMEGQLTEPDVTLSEELRKETNFDMLPDGSQIVLGSMNMGQFGQDLEFMAPFVCILAATVARKYAIYSWSKDIVDYVLKCGSELYKVSNTRYDQVYKLEIPKISLGKADYSVRVEYMFDTFMKPRILEMALMKILFAKTDVGILVTPSYACTLIHKNHLFYLYDGFGNNEVGLGQGRENKGVACLARFKSVHELAARIIHNKTARETSEAMEYNRFVLSACLVKVIKKPSDEPDVEPAGEGEDQLPGDDKSDDVPVKRYPKPKKRGDDDDDDDWTEGEEGEGEGEDIIEEIEQENKVGYRLVNMLYKIQGSAALSAKEISDYLKDDFFVCLCACLMTLEHPIEKWDTKRMDHVLELGMRVYETAEDRETYTKKIIKNLLIEDYIFNLIMKKVDFGSWKAIRSVKVGIQSILNRKQENILLQYPNRSYVICVRNNAFHLFDPCDSAGKASWTKYLLFNKLIRRIKANQKKGAENYNFHTFEVTSIRKAPKHVLMTNREHRYRLHDQLRAEMLGQPFHEDVTWLLTTPLPWSPQAIRPRAKFNDYNEEIKDDLYSLYGNLSQNTDKFDEKTRGKQTLGNLVVAVAMTQIYEVAEWSAVILDSILVNGDNYTLECINDIKDADYELSVDDLKKDCSIFPYKFQVKFTPVVEGTIFLMRLKQFNLSKALRYFFNDYEKRFGILCANQNDKEKRQVAFGKTNENEYFMFDCSAKPRKGFCDDEPPAYVLRCTNINRLLYVLVMTLRCGDFYIYDIALSQFSRM